MCHRPRGKSWPSEHQAWGTGPWGGQTDLQEDRLDARMSRMGQGFRACFLITGSRRPWLERREAGRAYVCHCVWQLSAVRRAGTTGPGAQEPQPLPFYALEIGDVLPAIGPPVEGAVVREHAGCSQDGVFPHSCGNVSGPEAWRWQVLEPEGEAGCSG